MFQDTPVRIPYINSQTHVRICWYSHAPLCWLQIGTVRYISKFNVRKEMIQITGEGGCWKINTSTRNMYIMQKRLGTGIPGILRGVWLVIQRILIGVFWGNTFWWHNSDIKIVELHAYTSQTIITPDTHHTLVKEWLHHRQKWKKWI